MRGFPVLNLLLTLVLSAGVLLPLVWKYTRSAATRTAADTPPADDPAGKLPAHVSLRFVHAPARVRLTDGGELLHEWSAPQSLQLEETVQFPVSEGRMSFGLQIEWPAGTPEETNVVAQVEPRGFQSWKDAFFGAGGTVDEIIEISCRP